MNGDGARVSGVPRVPTFPESQSCERPVARKDRRRSIQFRTGLFHNRPPHSHVFLDEGAEFAWDSLQHLNLVLALEEAFDLRFRVEDVGRMRTLGEVVRMVRSRLNGAA